MFDRWGRRWECIRGNAAVEPEGWFLELRDVTDDQGGDIVLIARWPDGGELVVTSYRADVTREMMEWFTAQAKEAIAPTPGEPDRGV